MQLLCYKPTTIKTREANNVPSVVRVSESSEKWNTCSSYLFCWLFLPVFPPLHPKCCWHWGYFYWVCLAGDLSHFLEWSHSSFQLLCFPHHFLGYFSILSSFLTHWLVLPKKVYFPKIKMNFWCYKQLRKLKRFLHLLVINFPKSSKSNGNIMMMNKRQNFWCPLEYLPYTDMAHTSWLI